MGEIKSLKCFIFERSSCSRLTQQSLKLSSSSGSARPRYHILGKSADYTSFTMTNPIEESVVSSSKASPLYSQSISKVK